MSTLVDLFKSLHSEIEQAMSPIKVERRYMPRRDSTDLDEVKIAVYCEDNDIQEVVRDSLEVETYTFGIAVQRNAAEQMELDANGNPIFDGIDNLAFGDEIVNTMEKLKDLWRANGPLRNKELAGCVYAEMVHSPIIEPIHLLTMGVYTSILDVTYRTQS